jgi:hypothetical protein
MKFTVPVQTARPLLMRPALFSAKDDSRPVLNTVHIEAHADGRIVCVAADGFILGIRGNGKSSPITFYVAASPAVGDFLAVVMPIYVSGGHFAEPDQFIARLTSKPKRTRKKAS